MDKKILEHIKPTTPLVTFFLRKISKYFTYIFIKLGFNPEPICLSWGIINVINGFFIYKAIIGELIFIPVFFLVHLLTRTLDVVDGDIARYRNRINPISGKLLDGIGHRMTEYSILIAFTFGIYHKTHNELCLLIGFITFFGEAMERYCRERKLLVVRLYAKKEVHQKMSSKTKRYPIDASFFSLTFKEQIECLKGLFLYRQVYFIIILS